MKIYVDDFVNENVINIFSDASMWPQMDKSMIGCYGFITMHGNQEINSAMFIDSNSTVNKCEAKGVKIAILEAIRLRNLGFRGIINIFCDSQITILNLREWMYSWHLRNGNLVNNSGNEVSNQSEFIEMMQLINKYNPNIFFYHQKGHTDTNNHKMLMKAVSCFKRSNMNDFTPLNDIDINFIRYISSCNNEIDNRTRWYLRKQSNAQSMNYSDPFTFVPTEEFYDQLHTLQIITGGIIQNGKRN